MPASCSPRLLIFLLSLGGALSNASCTALLTPNQRQELETRVYAASMRDTFSAARDTVVNRGYQVIESDFDGGILTFERHQRTHSPSTALTLSVICPSAGDFYMERYGWGVLDALLWPFSILWAVPSNFRLAQTTVAAIRGTMSFDQITPESTRTRITLSGIPWDVEKYPLVIRDLQEEIERQLFIRQGARPRAPP